MTLFTRAVSAASGLALVSLTAASAQPPVLRSSHAERPPNVRLVAQLGARSTALDASPDPAGKVIYYTTGGESPGIFSVAAGGGTQRQVLAGGLLRRPAGLAVSSEATTASAGAR